MYGMEVTNRDNEVIFGTRHLAITKLASGVASPQYFNSSTKQYANIHQITLPQGYDKYDT